SVKNELLDSLQYKVGRDSVIALFTGDRQLDLYPYYWQVSHNFSTVSGGSQVTDEVQEQSGDRRRLRVNLGTNGRFVELLNPTGFLPSKRVNRNALQFVFEPEADSSASFLPSISDSVLIDQLYFNFERNDRRRGDVDDAIGGDADMLSRLQQGFSHRYTRSQAHALARYYLEKSAWSAANFTVDTTVVRRVGGFNAARVQFTAAQPIIGQDLNLAVTVAPTGELVEMQVDYNPETFGEEDFNEIWIFLRLIIIVLFGIGALVIFYMRIRARVIDTRSALVVAIIAGIMIPAVTLLSELDDPATLMEEGNFDLFILAVNVGLGAAFASIGYFVLAAISDSITRQYWPSKLDSFDYLRQGMLFNKPIGQTVLRSVLLMFILAGSWSLLLELFPRLYMSVHQPIFLSEGVVWPPVYLLFNNGWFSLLIILGVFSVVASQTYGQTGNRWLAGLFAALSCGIITVIPSSYGPDMESFLIFSLIGLVLMVIYLFWDLLTLLISHFLFITLISISTGWIVQNSPDMYVFVIFVVMLLVLTAGSVFAIAMGKEEKALPEYVPDYMEELAHEQRIRQELEIAREVQQSFLPVRKPDFKTIDLAAICKPAYETGGDYYDFIPLDDHRVAVAIGDVSGKGIQAAFYMTFIKGILHSLCREISSPASLLQKANKLFYDNAPRGTFISLIFGIVDTREQTFRFARAGHNPVLFLEGRNGNIRELQPDGLGLGMTPGEKFDSQMKEEVLPLQSEDLLVLYTDGFIEALNQAHQFYGTNRLTQMLKQNQDKPAEQIIRSVMHDVTNFVGKAKQHDDMTMLLFKIKNG
ncbi:MAG: PP2C family protein-serine/threonine phosphatase, partial [Balneolaceae bacterium]|nr:PP2C family protein-serine/threonine phosphatase [Balneolaceae bacterium]